MTLRGLGLPDEHLFEDGDQRLDDAAFWPAFLSSVGGSPGAATAFDVDPADVEQYIDDLHRHDRWPAITVELARGHRMHLHFRNFADDEGWDYLFQPVGIDDVITAAALEGSSRGPALSWAEAAGSKAVGVGRRSASTTAAVML